eukprot:3215805-Prymnesium_polylepis.4
MVAENFLGSRGGSGTRCATWRPSKSHAVKLSSVLWPTVTAAVESKDDAMLAQVSAVWLKPQPHVDCEASTSDVTVRITSMNSVAVPCDTTVRLSNARYPSSLSASPALLAISGILVCSWVAVNNPDFGIESHEGTESDKILHCAPATSVPPMCTTSSRESVLVDVLPLCRVRSTASVTVPATETRLACLGVTHPYRWSNGALSMDLAVDTGYVLSAQVHVGTVTFVDSPRS